MAIRGNHIVHVYVDSLDVDAKPVIQIVTFSTPEGDRGNIVKSLRKYGVWWSDVWFPPHAIKKVSLTWKDDKSQWDD